MAFALGQQIFKAVRDRLVFFSVFRRHYCPSFEAK
jgi:hypothetical protein